MIVRRRAFGASTWALVVAGAALVLLALAALRPRPRPAPPNVLEAHHRDRRKSAYAAQQPAQQPGLQAVAPSTPQSALQLTMPGHRPCRGFEHMHVAGACKRHLKQCYPKTAFYWRGRALDSDHCARARTDRVCGKDVALLLMTSNNTAARAGPAMSSWVPAAQGAGISLILGVASREGAASVRAVAPNAPVVIVDAKEEATHGGSQHVVAALRRLYADFPGKKWYGKMDDDAFLFPSNLLYALAYHHVNASKPVIVGNTLFKDASMVSGGAGYVMSAPAMKLFVEAADCFAAADPAANEDVIVSGCLREQGVEFVHIPGFYMSQPDGAFDEWRDHHWSGETRYPVTFHWLRDPRYSVCLGCTCMEDA